MRSCGYEWPTCGPATKSGLPVAERERPTRSAFDIWRRGSGTAAPGTTGSKLPSSSDDLSGRRRGAGLVRERLATETGAAACWCARRSFHTASPAAPPSRSRSASRNSELRVSSPPPDAEDRADERGDGDHVVPRPRRDPEAGPRVVGVDPRHVRVDVGDHAAAAGALARAAARPAPRARASVAGVGVNAVAVFASWKASSPGTSSAATAARPAQQVHQQAAVLGRGPARAEHDVAARPAVHVRNVPAVAPDDDAGPRPNRPHDAAVGAEPGRLEEALQVGRADVPVLGREPVVEGELVGRRRREREAARLAGRQDVPRERGEVETRRARRADERDQADATRRRGARFIGSDPT